MNKAISILLISIILLCILVLYYPYFNNHIYLGGEGLFTLDYKFFFKKFFSYWFTDGFGHPNVLFTFIGLPQFIFLLLQNLKINYQIINLIYFTILFLFPFISFYLLARYFLKDFLYSLSLAFFFVFNIFSLSYLSAFNITNNSSLGAMTILIYILIKFDESKYKYLIFGLSSICLSYTFYNPPTAAVILFAVCLSNIFIEIFKKNKLDLRSVLIKMLNVILAYFLFNFWWIIPVFLSLSDASSLMSVDFAKDWERTSTRLDNLILFDLFFLKHFSYLPNLNNFTNSFFYIFPFMLYIFLFAKFIPHIKYNLVIKSFFLIIFIFVFLLKGSSIPFGFIYAFFIDYIPFFWIFKSPLEKFSLPLIFFICFLVIYLFTLLKTNFDKNIIISVMVLTTALPILYFNKSLFNHYSTVKGDDYISSKSLNMPEDYRMFINFYNDNNFNGRALLMPLQYNYQVMIDVNNDSHVYTGLDFVSESLNTETLRYDHFEFKDYSSDLFKKNNFIDNIRYFNIFDIQTIIVNKKYINWFGGAELPDFSEEFFHILYEDEFIKLLEYNNYKGRFFIPQKIINIYD